jgi:hypothetical protein
MRRDTPLVDDVRTELLPLGSVINRIPVAHRPP